MHRGREWGWSVRGRGVSLWPGCREEPDVAAESSGELWMVLSRERTGLGLCFRKTSGRGRSGGWETRVESGAGT